MPQSYQRWVKTLLKAQKPYMTPWRGLRMGSPIQKAQIMANLIEDFGVDIGTLDAAITGATPTEQPAQVQNQHFEQLLNEKLAPVQQFLEAQQVNTQQKAVGEVQSFAEKRGVYKRCAP